ncbi:MAG: hypothetical protein ACXVRS_16575 [Gaiellaceae bacterium]
MSLFRQNATIRPRLFACDCGVYLPAEIHEVGEPLLSIKSEQPTVQAGQKVLEFGCRWFAYTAEQCIEILPR